MAVCRLDSESPWGIVVTVLHGCNTTKILFAYGPPLSATGDGTTTLAHVRSSPQLIGTTRTDL